MVTPQHSRQRIYLDNAATSWPKCSRALDAADEFVRQCGATAGRGSYTSSQVADRWLQQARDNLASLIGANSGNDIAMCGSGTHALNAALWGLLKPGDHVVTTSMEHNSVLRPLKQLERAHEIRISVIPSTRDGRADLEQARQHLGESTALIAVGHASNVTGAVNDLSVWCKLAQDCNAKLLVDASQTMGYIPIDVHKYQICALAAAGHKGLRALAGTGLLYINPGSQSAFRPLMFGGTGRTSESIDAPPDWPQSVEVGNLNLPGIVSMAVAAEQLTAAADLSSSWQAVFKKLVLGLRDIPQVSLVGWNDDTEWSMPRIPVVSIRIDGWDVHDFAAVLDTSFHIEVRAGWHCAALVHADIGSTDSLGTLRLSTGTSTSFADIDDTLRAFQEILGN